MPKKRLPRRNFSWNSQLAYAIGLITTDGSLSSDKRHISLTSSDKQLLQTFKNCLRKTNKITKNPASSLSRKQSLRIQFGDVVFYDWLLKIGLFPNKSLTLGSLNIPKKYFRDFVRGHLDGDGSIISYIDRYNTKLNPKYVYRRLFVSLLSSSEKHVVWLRNVIYQLIGIRGSLAAYKSQSQKGRASSYRIRYSKKEALVFLRWIYYRKDLPFLQRKFLKAKPFLVISDK